MAYSRAMCQRIDRDQRLKGWRAFVQLLSRLKSHVPAATDGAPAAPEYRNGIPDTLSQVGGHG